MTSSIRMINLTGKQITRELVAAEIPRAKIDVTAAVESIRSLVESIRTDGAKPIFAIAKTLDGIDIEPIKVNKAELVLALQELSPELRRALEIAIERVRKVSVANLPQNTVTELAKGATVSQRWVPIESVGLYVPGGKAVYPSSVVMNVVPAQVAGVQKISIATPGQKAFGGRPHPTVLATAALLGVEDVYVIGGPAAVAAFAYGVPEIGLEQVDLVTGPGNVYVAAAKRILQGRIAIDSEAGPTEIMILADDSADPRFIAADLISQAEHDELAAAVLVTDSEGLISAVNVEIERQVAVTANRDRVLAALAGQQSSYVLVSDMDQAVAIANLYGAEHLSIQTGDSAALGEGISSAGAIFLGPYSPVSLGDYLAGSNHVLPTGGQARFSSGLGVHSFLKAQQLIDYDQAALSEVANSVIAIANQEGLQAHGDAVITRI
ncbi:MAG: histidinol dehydrogenase [Actinomycetes bacterium]